MMIFIVCQLFLSTVLASNIVPGIPISETIPDENLGFDTISLKDTSSIYFYRRQVFSQTAVEIDLNKVPPAEKAPKQSKTRMNRVDLNQPSRYSVPRTWTRIIVPEGLTKEEEKRFRHKVKLQRDAERISERLNSADHDVSQKAAEWLKVRAFKRRKAEKDRAVRIRTGQATEKDRKSLELLKERRKRRTKNRREVRELKKASHHQTKTGENSGGSNQNTVTEKVTS